MTNLITGETWGDEVESVRAHILAQSAQPFAVLLPELAASRAELLAALEGVTDEQAEFRPGSGEGEEAWGIAEVLLHFASIETIMAERSRLLGAGDSVEDLTPTYPGYMESIETRRLPDLIGAVNVSHASLLAAVADVEGHERLDAVAAHRRFGELNCRGWLVMHGLHLRDHARQVNRIKALDGFPTA